MTQTLEVQDTLHLEHFHDCLQLAMHPCRIYSFHGGDLHGTADAEGLQKKLKGSSYLDSADPIATAMSGMFKRDGLEIPTKNPDESLNF